MERYLRLYYGTNKFYNILRVTFQAFCEHLHCKGFVDKMILTAQKNEVFHYLNRFDQIRSFPQVWSHLLEKCVKENFLYSFCAVLGDSEVRCSYKIAHRVFLKKLFVSILKLSRNFTTCHQLNIIRQRGLLWLNLLKFILMKILKSKNSFRGNLYIKSYFLEFEDY